MTNLNIHDYIVGQTWFQLNPLHLITQTEKMRVSDIHKPIDKQQRDKERQKHDKQFTQNMTTPTHLPCCIMSHNTDYRPNFLREADN